MGSKVLHVMWMDNQKSLYLTSKSPGVHSDEKKYDELLKGTQSVLWGCFQCSGWRWMPGPDPAPDWEDIRGHSLGGSEGKSVCF